MLALFSKEWFIPSESHLGWRDASISQICFLTDLWSAFSHLRCAGLSSSHDPSSYTWALSHCKVRFNCLNKKHHDTRTAKGCQNLLLSDQINLHFHEPALKNHEARVTVGKDATQLPGTWGCLLGGARGWLGISELHKTSRARGVWIQRYPMAKWQLVIFPEGSALRQKLQRCAGTSATAERYCLSPPHFWLFFNPQGIRFSQKCQSNDDWKRCLSCGQNSSLFISFPAVSLTYTQYTHTLPNNFHATRTGFFLKEEKEEKKEAIICFSTLNTCETCSYKNSLDNSWRQ